MKTLLCLLICSVFGNCQAALGFSCRWYESVHLPFWKVDCFDAEDVNEFGCLFKPEKRVVEHTKVLIARGCIAPQGDIYLDEGGETVYYKRLYCSLCGTVKLPYIKSEKGKQIQPKPPTAQVSGDIKTPIGKDSPKKDKTVGSNSNDGSDSDDSDSSSTNKKHKPTTVSAKHDNVVSTPTGTAASSGSAGVAKEGIEKKDKSGSTAKLASSSESESDSEDEDNGKAKGAKKMEKDKNKSGKKPETSSNNGIEEKDTKVNVEVNVKVQQAHK